MRTSGGASALFTVVQLQHRTLGVGMNRELEPRAHARRNRMIAKIAEAITPAGGPLDGTPRPAPLLAIRRAPLPFKTRPRAAILARSKKIIPHIARKAPGTPALPDLMGDGIAGEPLCCSTRRTAALWLQE